MIPVTLQTFARSAPTSHFPPAATAESTAPPASHAAAPPLTTKPRGNPDLHLAPRCGAHTRAGCPCRAPAIRGKLRCRMHGGRSTGPRTPEGLARLRTARTIHGAYSAETRALNRHDLTELRRGRAVDAARRCLDRLPPDLAARLLQMPRELLSSPWPTGGLTPAQDHAVLRAETDALAAWRAAIAQAGLAGRAGRSTPAAAAGRPGASAEPHAPVLPHGTPAAARDAAGSVHPDGVAKPLAPDFAVGPGNSALAASPAAPAPTQPEVHAPERTAIPAASPAAPPAPPAKPHAPEHAADGRGAVPCALPAAHRGPMWQQAKAYAPERGAPERGPATTDAIPTALPNRAARRRWKSLQRHMQAAAAACSRP